MPSTSKVRLLYAEDGLDTRDLICIGLEIEGFEVICPDSSQAFLTLAKKEQWDVYMLDTWMPQVSGIDLCKKLREFDSATTIIFYSAAAFEHEQKQAFECGAQAYAPNPLTSTVLRLPFLPRNFVRMV